VRKAFLLVLLVLPGLLYATAIDGASDQNHGMSVMGVSQSGGYAFMFANPAALTGSDERLYILASYGDRVESGEQMVNLPSSSLLLSFCGTNLAFSVEVHNSMTGRTATTDGDTYDSTNSTRLQLDWAYAFRRFSFGLSLKTTTYMALSSVQITDGQRLSDYLVQSLFERYEPMYGATSLSAGFGLLYDDDWLKIGLVSDQFAKATTDGTINFSFMQLYRTLGFGLSVSTPTYSNDGQLNFCKLTVVAELLDVGDEDNASLKAGLDLRFQLLPDWQVSLRSGYHDTKAGLGLYRFNTDTGCNSFGIGLMLKRFRVDFGMDVPLSVYTGNGGGVPVTVSLAYIK